MSQSRNPDYLAHTAHWQFLGLLVGCVGWILTMVTAGLNEWRMWYVSDLTFVTSGVAWVGIWKACFYSHTLSSLEVCHSMGLLDGFVPVEISVAQVFIMVAVVVGLAGNISASFAIRNVYFSVEDRDNTKLLFSLAGTFYVLTGLCSLLPLLWNMSSVLTNQTIDFPPEFYLPPAPVRQEVGHGIAVGIFASIIILISGLLFLCYRVPGQARKSMAHPIGDDKDSLSGSGFGTAMSPITTLRNGEAGDHQGNDNPTFQTDDDL